MKPLGCYDYPLRPDCMAQLLLPWDLTERDVARLTAFLRSLIIPMHAEVAEGHTEAGVKIESEGVVRLHDACPTLETSQANTGGNAT